MNNVIYLKENGVGKLAFVQEIPNRRHNMFKVHFEDGYENVFYTDPESGKWMEEDLGFTALSFEIGEQLQPFVKSPIHVPKLLTWHKQLINGRIICFGFFNFRKGQHKMFEIYNSNKKYIYTLVEMENNEWQILGNHSSEIHNLDPVFVEHVVQILPLYWENAGK